jgi:hypothetical protein
MSGPHDPPLLLDTASLSKMLIGTAGVMQQIYTSRTQLIAADGNRASDEYTLNAVVHTLGLLAVGVAALLELQGGPRE